jgi:transcriptional pleiotropic regulator of transition state genes
VLPIETRRMLDIDDGTPLEIFLDGETIILRAYRPGCIFCGVMRDLLDHRGRQVCRSCLRALALELRQADAREPEEEAIAATATDAGQRTSGRCGSG